MALNFRLDKDGGTAGRIELVNFDTLHEHIEHELILLPIELDVLGQVARLPVCRIVSARVVFGETADLGLGEQASRAGRRCR